MGPALIVAAKEFRDHLTSKRFLVIFAVFLLLSVVSIATGMDQYNKNLESYKTQQAQQSTQDWFIQMVSDLQSQIDKAVANGAPQDEIDGLRYQLDSLINPPMPSMMFIFYQMTQYFTLIGMVLAISMGFDLITREKEEGSLKSLLSHPVFRDSVINGKTIGALAVLFVAMASAFLIIIAIMLFFAVVPEFDVLLKIAGYFGLALIFCLAFFAVGMMCSTLAKNSAMSVLFALGIVLAAFLLPQMSYQIANFVLGPAPEYKPYPYDPIVRTMDNNGTAIGGDVKVEPTYDIMPMPPIGWNDELQRYYQNQKLITDCINMISPISNFNTISNAILTDYAPGPIVYMSSVKPMYGGYGEPYTIFDALASVWMNIMAMLIMPFVAFVVSYIKFLRVDIR